MSTNNGMTAIITKKHQLHDKDTGSTEVQIALLMDKISYLSEHLKQNMKDKHTQLRLVMCVSKRKRLLKYLQKKNCTRYLALIAEFGLRK